MYETLALSQLPLSVLRSIYRFLPLVNLQSIHMPLVQTLQSTHTQVELIYVSVCAVGALENS